MDTGTDQFTSIYRHDFIPIDRGYQLPPRTDQLDRTYTINENPTFINISDRSPLPPPQPVDLAIEYSENTFKAENPKLYNKYFKTSLQTEEILPELLKDTIYVQDYCRHTKGPVVDKYDLDIESAEAIQTTMRDHYRTPSKLAKLTRTLEVKPVSALSRNHEVVTSVAKFEKRSEYQRLIGSTGKFIMDNEMYGKVLYPS